jgi:hypothetical protein
MTIRLRLLQNFPNTTASWFRCGVPLAETGAAVPARPASTAPQLNPIWAARNGYCRRGRLDKKPQECTFDQLEIVPPHELTTIFASGR